MHVDDIWTEPSVRATVKLNAELQVLPVHKKSMQLPHVLSEIHQKGDHAEDRPTDKGRPLPIPCQQLQLKAIPKSTRHVSSGGLASATKEMLANTPITKFRLDRVALKGEEKAMTAEATPRDVHLQTLVLQRKRNLSYVGIFPKVLAIRETTANTLILPLLLQVQVLLPQPLWSQQSLQTLSLHPLARQLSFQLLGDQRLEHRTALTLQRNLASSLCVTFFLVAPYTGQTISLRSSLSTLLHVAPFREWTGHLGMPLRANLQTIPMVYRIVQLSMAD